MNVENGRAKVLIIADDGEAGEQLCSWIAEAGEEPVLITGVERNFLERGDDEQIDLVVTQVDASSPDARRLLSRLLSGELFFGIPQVHIYRDVAAREAP